MLCLALLQPLCILSSPYVNSGRASSIGIILLGSIWYTWIKHEESQAKAQYEPVALDELERGSKSISENGSGNDGYFTHTHRHSQSRSPHD